MFVAGTKPVKASRSKELRALGRDSATPRGQVEPLQWPSMGAWAHQHLWPAQASRRAVAASSMAWLVLVLPSSPSCGIAAAFSRTVLKPALPSRPSPAAEGPRATATGSCRRQPPLCSSARARIDGFGDDAVNRRGDAGGLATTACRSTRRSFLALLSALAGTPVQAERVDGAAPNAEPFGQEHAGNVQNFADLVKDTRSRALVSDSAEVPVPASSTRVLCAVPEQEDVLDEIVRTGWRGAGWLLCLPFPSFPAAGAD